MNKRGALKIRKAPFLIKKIVVCSVLSYFFLTGCSSRLTLENETELVNQILQKDAEFVDVVENKALVDKKIKLLKAELSEKKSQIRDSIEVLKKSLKEAELGVLDQIRDEQSELNSIKVELADKIKELSKELRLKEASLNATIKMTDKFRNLAEQGSSLKDIKKEASKWRTKIASLNEQADQIQKEIGFIKEKLELNKLKMKLLE
ncbi:MAG: hypothetical protein ABIB11_01915 [Candidatus Omnitrophota bacterium]